LQHTYLTDESSQKLFDAMDLQRNADGSVDIFIGAKAPAGMEINYMKTGGTDGWFVIFRL